MRRMSLYSLSRKHAVLDEKNESSKRKAQIKELLIMRQATEQL